MIIHVLGHTGCSKCEAAQKRIARLLQTEPYKDRFSMQFHDSEPRRAENGELLESDRRRHEEDMMFFCLTSECNARQNVPVITVRTDDLERLPPRKLTEHSLTVELGLYTDYVNGNGVITAEEIENLLKEAIIWQDN